MAINNFESIHTNKSYDGHKYIVWFFYMLCVFAAVIILLLLFLKTNVTVPFTKGEIIAATPQTDYKAPFEARLSLVKIKPGEKITKGDTLIILHNENNNVLYAKEKAEAERLQQLLVSVNNLLGTVDNKAGSLQVETGISGSDKLLQEKNIYNAVTALETQYELQRQKLASALERNRADSILYYKEMISKMEYNAGKDITADIRESLAATEAMLKKQMAEIDANNNNFKKTTQNLAVRKIQTQQELQTLLQQKSDTEYRLLQSKETLALLEHNISSQYIVAAVSGTVNFIFNSTQSSNIIGKDQLLVSISPDAGSYYAKAFIAEKDISYLRDSMVAHIQPYAYPNLEQGILNGQVSYISDRKENDTFYALIQLNNSDAFALRPGYSIEGEIVTEKLPLYKYFIRKLFNKEKKQ